MAAEVDDILNLLKRDFACLIHAHGLGVSGAVYLRAFAEGDAAVCNRRR